MYIYTRVYKSGKIKSDDKGEGEVGDYFSPKIKNITREG
jgi:hypothetical protein